MFLSRDESQWIKLWHSQGQQKTGELDKENQPDEAENENNGAQDLSLVSTFIFHNISLFITLINHKS